MAGRTTSAQALSRRCNVATRIRKLLALWRPALNLALAAGLLADFAGCTRSYYRKSADEEVAEVLAQKDKYPAWAIQNWHVYPDPRARFADPTNPDRPPMPPDDPAAYCMSPNPQKPKHVGVARVEGTGYLELLKAWDAENRAAREEEKAKEEKAKEGEKQPDQAKEKPDEKAEAVKPAGVFGGITPEARAAM